MREGNSNRATRRAPAKISRTLSSRNVRTTGSAATPFGLPVPQFDAAPRHPVPDRTHSSVFAFREDVRLDTTEAEGPLHQGKPVGTRRVGVDNQHIQITERGMVASGVGAEENDPPQREPRMQVRQPLAQQCNRLGAAMSRRENPDTTPGYARHNRPGAPPPRACTAAAAIPKDGRSGTD